MFEQKIVRVLGMKDDIIAEVSRQGRFWKLKNACFIKFVPVDPSPLDVVQQPGYSIQMLPLKVPYIKGDTILFSETSIMFSGDVDDEVAEKHRAAFSQIDRVSSMILPA